MFSPQIDAWIYSQPPLVWVCVALAIAALAYKYNWLNKLKGGVKSPVDKSSPKCSEPVKYSEPAATCYASAVVAPTVLEGLLPPAVVEMRKSTAVMKQQLADAVALETEATVKEYTKYMTLTTGVALATQKPVA